MGKSSGGTRGSSASSPRGLSEGWDLNTALNRIERIAGSIADKKSTGSPYIEETYRGFDLSYSRKNTGESDWTEIAESARITISEDGRNIIVTASRSEYERKPFSSGNTPNDFQATPTGDETKVFSVGDSDLTKKIDDFLKKR